MKYLPLTVSSLPAQAMALYPVILFKNDTLKKDKVIIRHELIHFKQQIELLVLPFYLLYFVFYLINLLVYRDHHLAYLNICFEREAYSNDANPGYLISRRHYAWIKYIRS